VSELEQLVEKLEWFVDQPSVTRQEKDIADTLERRLSSTEFILHRWRDGIVALPQGAPKFLLAGHLDTVPPSSEQTRKREDGRVYGCGTSDMKAGLAVMLQLLETRPEAPVGYIFYDREEGPIVENGLRPLLESVPDLPKVPTIVLEPTNGEVQVGCVGSFHLDVTFHGKRAHAARPWQGENALYLAAPFLQYLSEREPDEIELHGQTFRQVITPTILSTHTLSNAVPGEVTINLNVRFAPGQSAEVLIEEVKAKAGDKATVVLKDLAPAGQVCHADPTLAPWIAARNLTVAPKQAWTDVAQLTDMGFPAVNFGPGEPAQAHQPDEWCPENGLTFCFQELLHLIES
jgi:succinyl-diaminopimelate desuccinylase